MLIKLLVNSNHRRIRVEALDHFIFFYERHIYKVCKDYMKNYNHGRPSQALRAIPDPYPELKEPLLTDSKIVSLPILCGIHHDDRLVAKAHLVIGFGPVIRNRRSWGDDPSSHRHSYRDSFFLKPFLLFYSDTVSQIPANQSLTVESIFTLC